jgi:Cdc6-like AAA superfamily ATPase
MSSKLCFSEWPFHTLPDDEFVKVWCGRPILEKKLDDIFARLIQKPGFQIRLVYGDFGVGKTHCIRHMLNKYSQNAKLLTSELEYDVSIKTFSQLYRALVNRMDFIQIQDWSIPPSQCRMRDFEYFYKFMKSADEEKKAVASQWFAGQERGKKVLNGIGIKNPIIDTDTAVRAFSELTKLAGKNRSAVVLFIDEFQHIGKLNSNWRDNILNGLTKLVNESPNHLCLIISFRLRMPANILSIIPENMVQRFSGDPFIEFKNFSKEEASEFIMDLFTRFRNVKSEDNNFPYTKQSVEDILQFLNEHHVEYNPRSLMKVFEYVSECFENSEEMLPISSKFARERLKSYVP